jgi:hypothetical protein
VVKSGSGIVRSTPPGIDCGAACSAAFDPGTNIILTAVADAGWSFAGWSGACGAPMPSSPTACSLALVADGTVYATFQVVPQPPGPTHKLEVARSGDGKGRVTSDPGGIDCGTGCSATFAEGTAVALSATPEQGSKFAGWGGACSGSGSGGCTLTISGDTSATATFSLLPPPDECEGMAPPAAGPAPYEHTIQARADCQRGLTDGWGVLALGVTTISPFESSKLDFLTSTGQLLASYPGKLARLTPQLSGFEGVVLAPDFSWALEAWDTKGQSIAKSAAQAGFVGYVAEDPTGGFVLIHHSNSPPVVESYDEHLNLRWRAPLPLNRAPAALAVDRVGNTLALFEGDMNTAPKTADGMWIDRAGAAGPVFRAVGPMDQWAHLSMALTQRVGSGLFVWGGGWIGQIDSLATTVTPPPDWLKARSHHLGLHMVHGGKAYGVMDVEDYASDCPQTIEVVATSGKSCGKVAFRSGADTCKRGPIVIGYDGTVIQEAPFTCIDGGPCTCSWHWWPGFFH